MDGQTLVSLNLVDGYHNREARIQHMYILD